MNYSQYYRTFSNALTVRTITGEYLAAMKLMAYRQNKHDISDVVGILREQAHTGKPLSFEQIDKAVCDLYDSWEKLPKGAPVMLQSILAEENLDARYESCAQEEAEAKDALLTFDEKYPDVLQEDNLSGILNHLLGQ